MRIVFFMMILFVSCKNKISNTNYIDGIFLGTTKAEPLSYIENGEATHTSTTGISFKRAGSNVEESLLLDFKNDAVTEYFNREVSPYFKEEPTIRMYVSQKEGVMVVDSVKLSVDIREDLFKEAKLISDTTDFKPYSDKIVAYYLGIKYVDKDSLIVYTEEGDPFEYNMSLAIRGDGAKKYFLDSIKPNTNVLVDIFFTTYKPNKSQVDSVRRHNH